MKIAASDIVFLLSLGLVGTGLYLRFGLGTALVVDGFILLWLGVKMAPTRKQPDAEGRPPWR
jgi:hypothetical protein